MLYKYYSLNQLNNFKFMWTRNQNPYEPRPGLLSKSKLNLVSRITCGGERPAMDRVTDGRSATVSAMLRHYFVILITNSCLCL